MSGLRFPSPVFVTICVNLTPILSGLIIFSLILVPKHLLTHFDFVLFILLALSRAFYIHLTLSYSGKSCSFLSKICLF